ncbi:MAG: c-type cytochrome [Mangrovibacterium sp.]
MNKLLFSAVIVLMLFLSSPLKAQNKGESLFKTTCIACHTINGGKLIGPDLAGINERRKQDWLISFIRSSQKMVNSGDSLAAELFEKYKIPMPDNNYSDDEILSILSYIKETSDGASAKEATATQQVSDTVTKATAISYSPDLIKRGKALFYGYEKFANGASSCNACHSVNDGSIIGGGRLSFNLTGSYGRLGAAGIQAILSNPPFPPMNVALRNKHLTDDEKEAITAMLQSVNSRDDGETQDTQDGFIFLLLSMVFALFLLVHIYIIYDDRKLPS